MIVLQTFNFYFLLKVILTLKNILSKELTFKKIEDNESSTLEIKNLKMNGKNIKGNSLVLVQENGQVNLNNIEISEATDGTVRVDSGLNAKTIMNNVNIHNNKSDDYTYSGISLGSNSNLDINNTRINNNSNFKGGFSGAIQLANYKVRLNINNSEFRSNSSKVSYTSDRIGAGGAIGVYNLKGNIKIKNSYFKENAATMEDGSKYSTYDGGAIYIFDGRGGADSQVSNSTFDSNLAHYGGAIMLKKNYKPESTTKIATKITNSTFYGNKAYGLNKPDGIENDSVSGGAITYFKEGDSSVMSNKLLSCAFVNN